MKLIHLSIASVVFCVVGLISLSVAGLYAVERLHQHEAAMLELLALQGRIGEFSVASDAFLLYGPDQALWRAYLEDAHAIRQTLQRLGREHPSALRAARHVELVINALEAAQVTAPSAEAAAGAPATAANPPGALDIPLRSRIIMSQVAGHGIALDTVLQGVLRERETVLSRQSNWLIGGFALSTVLFGVLCILAFGLIYRRISGPVHVLSRTMGRIADGHPELRVAVSGKDEVSELGRAFNHLLDRQQSADARLLAQQAELREQARLLEIGAQVARFGGWWVDLETNRCHWSAMVAEIHGMPGGYSPSVDEGIGFYAPEYRERIAMLFSACVRDGTPYDVELQIISATGVRCWVRTAGHPVRDARGEITGVHGAFQDITERMALEARLRQSQRLESLGQLTGGIAHDFNNVLTVVMGNAEMLLEQLGDDSRLAPLAAMIGQGADRGAELTHRLLAFARKQPLEPAVVDINALVGGLEDLLSRTLGEHVQIDMRRSEQLWPALIDAVQLESALLNLALNARDAMVGGGLLIIETANVALDQDYADAQLEVSPGQYVLVAVSGNGPGIAAEHLDRVFEPFFTTKEQGKGTGLGLPMVFGFVKQSGGHIRIYSEVGEGTTVKMYLPRSRAADALEPVNPENAEPDHGNRGDGETILVVEDELLVRGYVQEQLALLGYRVLVAGNGHEALEIIRQANDQGKAIDLLFSDVVMPGGMNGPQLAAAARELGTDLRVLFTSGYTENAIVHHGRLDPGVLLLSKPYHRSELAAKVRVALNRPRLADRAADT